MPIHRGPSAPARDAAAPATAGTALAVLPEFADGMAALPGELGALGRRLQSASRGEDWRTCQRLLQQFLDKYLREFAASLEAGK